MALIASHRTLLATDCSGRYLLRLLCTIILPYDYTSNIYDASKQINASASAWLGDEIINLSMHGHVTVPVSTWEVL